MVVPHEECTPSRATPCHLRQDQLTEEFQRWMKQHNIPRDAGDAEDMLRGSVQLTTDQRAYLEDFCSRWDASGG
jgi:hypothetical protein